jgi:hypothetical protein
MLDEVYRAEPVTASQAAVFYADQKGLYQCAYNITTVIVVTGSFTCSALVSACHRLVAATPAMRIRMGLIGPDGDVGYWFSAAQLDVEVIDSPGAADDDARRLIDSVAVKGFESDGGPLARFVIVYAASNRAYLALVCHHLVVDGPSHSWLALRLGMAVEEELAVERESDYANLVRQVRSLERAARENDLAYWRTRLPEGVGATEWSSVAPRPDGLVAVGGCSLTVLPPDTAERLEHAASADGIRIFHLIAAAVHWSLPERAAGRTIISTGASIRPRTPFAGEVAGYFINEVPLLAVHEADESPRSLAIRESPRWRDDLRRRYVSFAELATRTTRREGYQSTLDRVMLSYRTQPRRLAWRGREADFSVDLYPKSLQEKSDLTIRIFHDAGSIECDVQWSAALPPGVGEQFTRRLLAVLTEI